MIKANGIAGVFLYANDPKKLAEWYTLHLGLEFLSDIADTYFINPRRKTPVFRHGDIRRVPCLGLGHWGIVAVDIQPI